MGKKRIHELAKELSMTSAELLQHVSEMKLLPGVKLGASNSIDDAVADELRVRLGGTSQAVQSATTVVRRRKKAEHQAARDESSLPRHDQEAEEKEVPKGPIKIAPRPFEKATIIGVAPTHRPPEPSSRDRHAHDKPKTPDFLKLSPVVAEQPPAVETSTSPEPETVDSQPVELPVVQEVVAGVQEDKTGVQPVKTEKIPEKGPEPEHPQTARRVTHELGAESARGNRDNRNRFEAARVVGVKPNWKDAKGETPRPQAAAPGQARTEDHLAAKRPQVARPRPGESRDVPAVAVVPPAEHEGRKRDRKKRGHGYGEAGTEEAGAAGRLSKRRELVERTDLYSEGNWERARSRKSKMSKKTQAKTEITQPKAIKRRIKVDEVITVSELAHRLSLKAGDIIKKLMAMGVMAGQNQSLDFDTATLVAAEFGYEVEKSAFDEGDYLPLPSVAGEFEYSSRSPVVTIMGHVDHGKTSLLDYIRKTKIQEGEAGGITQHIGAYHVEVGSRFITFLDTPGHEAFTSMRSRGAQVTDLVILIVAADDGVMPQTREAADHARAANVPIIVAVNKIDKEGADPERIRREMMNIGLAQEAWGGETVFCDISAKTGKGVDELLEMILLQSDILDLKTRRDGPARGRIIEARLDKGRGAVATLLVEEGCLRQGDPYVCGVFCGKVRALFNDQGQRVDEAGPSIPVEIQGISGVPQAGDEFIVMEDEKQARQVSQHRLLKQRESELVKTSKLTLENLFDNIKVGAVKGLNLIVKADVQGSLEAIVDALGKLSTQEIKITLIHQSTGVVSETDIMLASASRALVICFGVRPSAKVQELADAEQIQVRYYDIIYKLLDDIKEAMAGLLDPVKSEKVLGQAEVRAVFSITRVGAIAGSYVTDGKMLRGARIRLVRDGVVVHEGRIASIKREKDDVREVNHGYECGISLENYNDVKVGDVIEAYQIEETAATVELVNEAVEREQARSEAAAANPTT